MRKIPLFKVFMPESVKEPLLATVFSGFITEGPKAKEFQERFQAWIGNPHIALMNSCTSAITVALRLCDVKPGDEVIATPQTCLATNEPIALLGAKIVWADIDPATGNIDPASIEKRITPKTKAIIYVHWSGIPAKIDEINALAKKHKLKVIEDAAHALGALYKGKKIGNHSDFVCYSFQAIKHLTTADGGALACKRKEDYEQAILLRWFGMSREDKKGPTKWEGDVYEAGYKFHMNDLNATIGIEQLKHMDGHIKKYIHNAEYLRKQLQDVPSITLLRVEKDVKPSYWLFGLKLKDAATREKFSSALNDAGIGNGIVHLRNDHYSLFKAFQRDDLPGMDDFGSRMINIPCGWWLSQEDLEYMVEVIKKTMKDIMK